MKHRQTGFIFITTLFMISILALLILSLMQSIFLYAKTSNQRINHHQALYQLENVALKLNVKQTSHCVIFNPDFSLPKKLLRDQRGCDWVEAQVIYHYIVSDLGVYPCLYIGSNASHHWLVSIVSSLEPSILLQVRFAMPENKVECQASDSRQIQQGIVLSLLTSA